MGWKKGMMKNHFWHHMYDTTYSNLSILTKYYKCHNCKIEYRITEDKNGDFIEDHYIFPDNWTSAREATIRYNECLSDNEWVCKDIIE